MLQVKKKTVFSTLILVFVLLAMAFPFYIMLIGAFKGNMALMRLPPDINPFKDLVITNYRYVAQNSDIMRWLYNSFTIGVSVALITIFIAATAGYALAKIQFRFSGLVFAVIIATMILPKQILLIPNFLVALNLNLTNKIIGVVLTTVSPAFGIFLCRQFMQTIPRELTESAEIDGCSEVGKFLRIIAPLSLPALGALGIFAFFGAFNDFLWQLIMISDKKLHTVPIGIAMFAQQHITNIGRQLMAATISTIPLIILFVACQRFFVRGITLGSVKG